MVQEPFHSFALAPPSGSQVVYTILPFTFEPLLAASLFVYSPGESFIYGEDFFLNFLVTQHFCSPVNEPGGLNVVAEGPKVDD